MKVAKNVVVSIAYQVRTEDGVLVDEAPANQPLQYLQGHNNLVIGLENALEGKSVGDKFEVRVKPEEGYGEYNENMVQRVPKDVFVGVEDLEVGMRFIADTDMGPLPVVITEVGDTDVVVDGNHMLAGQELHFTVRRHWKKSHTVIYTKKAVVVAATTMIAMKKVMVAVVAAIITTTIITTTIISTKVAVAVMVTIMMTIITMAVVAAVAANTKNVHKKDRTSMRSFVFMLVYFALAFFKTSYIASFKRSFSFFNISTSLCVPNSILDSMFLIRWSSSLCLSNKFAK